MKKLLLPILALGLFSTTAKSQCSDLMISEYVEGWSNNKAIELYNPTSSAIDLSAYELRRYSNGGTTVDATKKLALTGTVQPYDVFVIVIDKRDTNGTGQEAPVWDSLQVKADAFECPDYNVNNVMYFNGNDAMVLVKDNGTTIVDGLGKVGEDPAGGAWGTGGWTADHTLIRKASIQSGYTTMTANFDPSVQWDSLPANTFNMLGAHSCNCNPASVNEIINNVKVVMYPNPVQNENFLNINASEEINKIEIFSTIGKLENVQFANNSSTKIKISGYKPGLYLVRMQMNNGAVITKRITIK